MKLLLSSFVVFSTLLPMTSFAEKITLTTPANFNLTADYFQGKNNGDKAVLMLHQCNSDRSMYKATGKQLAQRGIHALSLDFRGFGDSVSDDFNMANIRELGREERRKKWRIISAHWPNDVKLAYDYLTNKLAKNGKLAVIGASCGGAQAITLAENNDITAIGFFSSAQRDANINRYTKNLADKATLIIAAQEDGRTFTSAQKIFSAAKHPHSKMLSYKGSHHGFPLFNIDKTLNNTIVSWFEHELAK